MPEPHDVDVENRRHALALAVQANRTDAPAGDILEDARKFLGFLRRPTPAADLNLRVGEPIEKEQ